MIRPIVSLFAFLLYLGPPAACTDAVAYMDSERSR